MDDARTSGRIWKDRLEAWWSSRTHEVLLALGTTALLVYGSYGEAHPTHPGDYFSGGHQVPHTPFAAYLLVAAACLVLAWRRRWPAAVLAASTAAVVVYSLLGYVNGAAAVAPMIALYSLAVRVNARQALAWGAGMLVVLMAATLANNPLGPTGGGFLVMPFVAAVAWFAGIAVRNRRAYVDSLQDRAERDARRRIDEERLRIARELHDVVAHTMATINVQAAAAAHLLTDRPERAAESLAAIRASSKDGLRELRAILNVLRQADEPADPTEPAPGLAWLDALAAGVRQAGLPVAVSITGQPRTLPAVTDLAAFRIIQEALTNAIRHAGPATAKVSLAYGETGLRLEVTDTGRGVRDGWTAPGGSPGPLSGHGLRGMRERAAAAGGTTEIGPGPSGGFRVVARFPAGGSLERGGEPAPPQQPEAAPPQQPEAAPPQQPEAAPPQAEAAPPQAEAAPPQAEAPPTGTAAGQGARR